MSSVGLLSVSGFSLCLLVGFCPLVHLSVSGLVVVRWLVLCLVVILVVWFLSVCRFVC